MQKDPRIGCSDSGPVCQGLHVIRKGWSIENGLLKGGCRGVTTKHVSSDKPERAKGAEKASFRDSQKPLSKTVFTLFWMSSAPLKFALTKGLLFSQRLLGACIGGVRNGQSSRVPRPYSEAEICRKSLELPHKEVVHF